MQKDVKSMKKQKYSARYKARANRRVAFTIMELGIVLLIIGALLAAIMVGRDVVRNAQIKRFHQQFVMKWVGIASSYYDRTGNLFADGGPHGGQGAFAVGSMDGVIAFNSPNAMKILRGAGLDPCTLVKSNTANAPRFLFDPPDECNGRAASQYRISGEYSGEQVVSIYFVTANFATRKGTSLRHALILNHVPTDVAIALDTAIDGVPDGRDGNVLSMGQIGPNHPITTRNRNPTIRDWHPADDISSSRTANAIVVVLLDF